MYGVVSGPLSREFRVSRAAGDVLVLGGASSSSSSSWNLTAYPLPVGRRKWGQLYLTLTTCPPGSYTCDDGTCIHLGYE